MLSRVSQSVVLSMQKASILEKQTNAFTARWLKAVKEVYNHNMGMRLKCQMKKNLFV